MYLTTARSLPRFPNGSVCGYENYPAYTGQLLDGTGITVQSNTTYVGYLNLGNGSLGTEDQGVVNTRYIGCCWASGGGPTFNALLYGSGFTFDFCTFQPGPFSLYPPSVKEIRPPQGDGPQYSLCADGTPAFPGTYNTYASNVTITNCDFWGFGNAACRLANGSSALNPYRVDYNYCHTLRLNTDGVDHNDGFGAPGSGDIQYLSLTRNYINAQGDTNALIYGAANSLIGNVLVSGNLFGGFGFTIAILNENGTSASNVTFTNNVFSTEFQNFFGPLYDQTILNSPGFTWRGNRWHVPPGAYWGTPSYDGYYWLPGYTSNAAPGFDELAHGLVGTSDYAP